MSSRPDKKRDKTPAAIGLRRPADRTPHYEGRNPSTHSSGQIDYRSVFERAPDAILVVDRDGRYVDANQAAEELTGYTREEILARHVGDLTVPDQQSVSTEQFDVLRVKGRARRDRLVLRKDGSSVPVDAHAIDLGNHTYVTILRDITRRVQREEELARSLEAYTTLMDLCGAAVVSAGVDRRIASWNPAAAELFGYSSAEAVGKPIDILIPERFRDVFRARFQEHVQTNGRYRLHRTVTTFAIRRDQSEFPVEIAVSAGDQGRGKVFTAVIRDISEQRRLFEQLNDALQRLNFHIERMPLAYIVWDTAFRIVQWNPAAERIFGYTQEEAIGKHAYELIVPPEVVPTVDKVWADLLAGDISSHSVNVNIRKNGGRLTCEWFNTPLRDAEGAVRGVASMGMDVTERELVEARIRDAQKLESLGLLAGGVAHDFNSSLMVILGNTSLLRALRGLQPRAYPYIELIEEAGLRASDLIKHLLAYARTGRHNPQPVNLNTIINEALLFLRSSIGKLHEVSLKLSPKLPLILADRSQIDQIIVNLCVNAMQAMPKGGTIDVCTDTTTLTAERARECIPFEVSPGEYVELLVSDSGCGMDRETVSRIFDPFFTTKAEGHGLGLAAVQGILRQHRAAAYVESARGKGTRFHVYFPVHHPNGDGSDIAGPTGRDADRRRQRRGDHGNGRGK